MVCRKYFLLGAILIIASVFRIYNLQQVPPSPSIDEVSIGWNAYSLLKTGKDEYGNRFPITLRAYDDYRPALYVYLVMPFVAIFGLTTMAVRLPSSILSIITVYTTYELVYSFSKKYRNTALLAAFFLAISPWHIYISRLGHEVNAGLSFLLLGLLFFVKYTGKTVTIYLLLSAFFLSLSFGSYQSEKIVVPVIVILLSIYNKKILMQHFRTTLMACGIGIVCSIPTIYSTLSPEGLLRYKGTTAFSITSSYYQEEQQLFVKALQNGDSFSRILYTPKLRPIKVFLINYFDHFKPQWLFTGTAEESHKVPYTGLLYIWEGIFLFIGIYALHKKKNMSLLYFCFVLLVTAFVPAAITTQTPHAMRSFTALPSYQILAAVGIVYFFSLFSKRLSLLLFVAFLGTVLFYVYKMSFNYFVVFPKTQSESFSYALYNSFSTVKEIGKKYNKIIFSNIIGASRFSYPSYMFFLFYSKYDPDTYLTFGGTKSGSFTAEHYFDKYEFKNISKEEREKDALYISTYSDEKNGEHIQYISKYLDNDPGVMIYTYE